MFNIFADALLIALQIGRPSVQRDRRHRRLLLESQDIEALNTANRPKHRDR